MRSFRRNWAIEILLLTIVALAFLSSCTRQQLVTIHATYPKLELEEKKPAPPPEEKRIKCNPMSIPEPFELNCLTAGEKHFFIIKSNHRAYPINYFQWEDAPNEYLKFLSTNSLLDLNAEIAKNLLSYLTNPYELSIPAKIDAYGQYNLVINNEFELNFEVVE